MSIPSWVDGIIYGTVLIVSKKTPRIQPNHTHTHTRARNHHVYALRLHCTQFWSFTFPQIIFQFLPPGFYWGTELIYCVLSLTAKLYLGTFLLINVRSPSIPNPTIPKYQHQPQTR